MVLRSRRERFPDHVTYAVRPRRNVRGASAFYRISVSALVSAFPKRRDAGLLTTCRASHVFLNPPAVTPGRGVRQSVLTVSTAGEDRYAGGGLMPLQVRRWQFRYRLRSRCRGSRCSARGAMHGRDQCRHILLGVSVMIRARQSCDSIGRGVEICHLPAYHLRPADGRHHFATEDHLDHDVGSDTLNIAAIALNDLEDLPERPVQELRSRRLRLFSGITPSPIRRSLSGAHFLTTLSGRITGLKLSGAASQCNQIGRTHQPTTLNHHHEAGHADAIRSDLRSVTGVIIMQDPYRNGGSARALEIPRASLAGQCVIVSARHHPHDRRVDPAPHCLTDGPGLHR